MKSTSILSSLGLSSYEASLYHTLLDIGAASPTTLQKTTKLHRPFVYKALESLLEKRLVTISIKGKRKMYSAESPDRLTSLFKRMEENLLSEIEELHTLHQQNKETKPVITFSEGNSAIRKTFMDVVTTLNKNETYYRYSPGYDLFDKENLLPRKYQAVRDSKQLERYVIANEAVKNYKFGMNKQIKTIPSSFDLFNDRIGQIIYRDKVCIVDYDTKTAITIQHKKFAEFQKKLFRLLFSKL